MLHKKQEILGTLALSLDEKRLLRTIFLNRLKLFLTVLLVMTAWILIANIRSGVTTEEVLDLSRDQLIFIRVGFLFILIYGVLAVLFFTRIFPFYKDYKYNTKEVVQFNITMKRYFLYNNQFYIGLDHPDYLFHEIEEEEWLKLKEGDCYPLCRAPFSKYVFNPRGRYSII